MIIQNQVMCHNCSDQPYSRHRHDYVECLCGNVAVDGGMEYLRRVGGPYKELSYSIEDKTINTAIRYLNEARDSGRNDLGLVLAVIRALNKDGYIAHSTTE